MHGTTQDILKIHPCFGASKGKFGRIHLPVAPKCNISCNYCDRKFACINQSRPGVTDKTMTAEEAMDYIAQNDTSENNLTVLGIAGAGEPLFNSETYRTLELANKKYPDKILCLSTNGLLLPEKFETLQSLGVNSITVTMNTIRKETAEKIYSCGSKSYIDDLMKNQQEGCKMVAKSDILLKINTVYIPGVNDQEIREIAKYAMDVGADIMNIMPLIPNAKFADVKKPTPEEIQSAKVLARCFVSQLEGCNQCRADACGVPSCGR